MLTTSKGQRIGIFQKTKQSGRSGDEYWLVSDRSPGRMML